MYIIISCDNPPNTLYATIFQTMHNLKQGIIYYTRFIKNTPFDELGQITEYAASPLNRHLRHILSYKYPSTSSSEISYLLMIASFISTSPCPNSRRVSIVICIPFFDSFFNSFLTFSCITGSIISINA